MMEQDQPVQILARAVASAQRDLGSKWQYLCDGFQHHAREAQENCGRAMQFLGQQSVKMNRRSSSPLAQLAVSYSTFSLRLFDTEKASFAAYVHYPLWHL